jgi:hypothetical protein
MTPPWLLLLGRFVLPLTSPRCDSHVTQRSDPSCLVPSGVLPRENPLFLRSSPRALSVPQNITAAQEKSLDESVLTHEGALEGSP